MDTAFPAHLDAQIDRVLTIYRAEMTDGDAAAITYVVHTPRMAMVPVEMHMPDEVAKAMANSMVRWTAKRMDADATIQVSEAWSLTTADMGKYKEILEQYGSIGSYPGKLDILMVKVVTREGAWMRRAIIETKGQARRCGKLQVDAVPNSDASHGHRPSSCQNVANDTQGSNAATPSSRIALSGTFASGWSFSVMALCRCWGKSIRPFWRGRRRRRRRRRCRLMVRARPKYSSTTVRCQSALA
jgi:hypothetical protein